MPSNVKQFRTPTGQTGRNAYVYELAAIQNERRDLDARMKRLTDAMAAELPESATYTHKMNETYSVTADIDAIRAILPMAERANSFSFETVNMILSTLNI